MEFNLDNVTVEDLFGESTEEIQDDPKPQYPKPSDDPNPDEDDDQEGLDEGGDGTDGSGDDPDGDKDGDEGGDSDNDGDQDNDDGGGESLISEISAMLGYEVEGEFEESVEGIAQYTKKVADQMANQKFATLFEKFPAAYEFIQHLAAGKSPGDFSVSDEPSYVNTDVKSASDDTLKQLVKDSMKIQGYEDDEIEEALTDYEDTGLLKNQGKIAQNFLKKHYQKEKARKQQELEAENQRIKEQQERTISEVKETIQSGVLGGNFVIPEKEKSEFQKWMFSAGKDGKTARDADMAKMTVADKLALEYLYFKKFNINDIALKKAKSLNAEKLRERLKTTKPKKMGTGARVTGKTSVDIPDFGALFG
jgi:hypothetical protein